MLTQVAVGLIEKERFVGNVADAARARRRAAVVQGACVTVRPGPGSVEIDDAIVERARIRSASMRGNHIRGIPGVPGSTVAGQRTIAESAAICSPPNRK